MRVEGLGALEVLEVPASLRRGLDALLTQEAVAGVLSRERARSDRTGRPFTMVVFQIPPDALSLRSIHRLALTALNRARITDDVGWFGNDSIAALLPETAVEGARTFARAVLAAMHSHLPDLRYTIYVYPSDWYGTHAANTPPGESGIRTAGTENNVTTSDAAASARRHPVPATPPVVPSSSSARFTTPAEPADPSTGPLALHSADHSVRPDRSGWSTQPDAASSALETMSPLLASNPLSPVTEFSDLSDSDIALLPAEESEERNAEIALALSPSLPLADSAALPMEPLFLRPLPAWKRAIDLVGASFGLLAATPVLLAAAIAIKLTDRGPIFFIQKRAGLGGKPFDMYKLRSMYMDAEARKQELMHLNERTGPVFKIANDPRVTRVGRFIRKTSIDELPQFLNVLKGDMSLVGPRPPTLDEVEKYQLWHRRRLEVTPGITCIWQVFGRSVNVSFEDWVRMDAQYVRTWGFWQDLKLILGTIPAVILQRGH